MGIILFLTQGIGISNLPNFIDSITLTLVLFPCLLMLFCTKSLKSFGACFLFAFGKGEYSLSQCKKCLLSIKTVISTSAVSGILCLMISCINLLKNRDWSSGSLELLGFDISVALLSIFYVFTVWILLLPLHIMLKQHMIQLLSDSGK